MHVITNKIITELNTGYASYTNMVLWFCSAGGENDYIDLTMYYNIAKLSI